MGALPFSTANILLVGEKNNSQQQIDVEEEFKFYSIIIWPLEFSATHSSISEEFSAWIIESENLLF